MSNVPLLDYAFLALESEKSPKHVAGLQIFDLPKNAPKDFVARLVKDIKRVEPTAPFNQRLHTSLLGRPKWQIDTEFDIDLHVVHEKLPPPHTHRHLMESVAALHEDKLDRSRPLWQLYVLEPFGFGSFALFFKVHHSYMDGISLTKRGMQALTETPAISDTFPFWGGDARHERKARAGIARTLLGSAKTAGKAAFVLPVLAKVGLKHGLRALNLSGRELPLPFTAPRTAFNTPLTSERSVATQKFSLPRVHKVANHAGVTINDVILELCDSAMTRYLETYDKVPDQPLVAQMPISLRKPGTGQGNQIGIALLELGSKEPNPVARLQHIHAHAKNAKKEFLAMSVVAAEIYTLLLQSVAQFAESTGLGRLIPPLGNVVVSNVPGPSKQLYLRGAPLRAAYPVSTISPGLAINITSFSYNKTLFFGIVAGKAAIPDLEPLVDYFEEALVELENTMEIKKPARKKPARKKPARKKRSKKPSHTSAARKKRAATKE